MKILVVDDHALIREALRGVVADLESNAVLVEASDGRQAMHLIAEHADVCLVLLDLNLPDRDGFSVLSELRERHPEISVVILSGDVHYAFAAHGWFSQGAEALAVLQLTSSALKNEAKEARNAEALSRGEAGRMAVQATRGVNIASTGVLEQGWEWGAQPPASPGLAALRNTLQQLQQRLAALPANDRARGDLQAEIQRTDIEVRRLEDVLAQRPVILDNLRDQDALAIAADPTWQLGYRYVPFRDRNFLESSANMGWVELQDELVIHRLAVSEGGTFQIETQRLDVSLSRALGVP